MPSSSQFRLNSSFREASRVALAPRFIGIRQDILDEYLAFLVRSLTSVPMVLPWTSVLIGVGLSSTVGLFFGIYPARQASRLDPIEALRVER